MPCGGVGAGGFDIATFANETPEALSPVPATTCPGMAEIAFATPFFGKSTAEIVRLGLHQSPDPPAPKTTSPPSVLVTTTPVFVPALKSDSVVSL